MDNKKEPNYSPYNGLTIGIIAEVEDFNLFTDDKKCFTLLRDMCTSFGLNVVNFATHVFPQTQEQTCSGISMVLLLAESHISIHTWPEKKTFRLILDSCVNIEHNEVLLYVLNVFCNNPQNVHFWVERWKKS